ncbi:hypothetical protein SAZ11_07855 [Streptomyces sp. FXJ1.4098]|nr:hypothetical protein [Streptomyces sp. FXJ1.4098]
MPTNRSNPYRAPLALVVIVCVGLLLVAGAFLVKTISTADDDNTPPRCHATRRGSTDVVAAGPRPCVLYSTRTAPAPGHRQQYQQDHPRPATKYPSVPARKKPKGTGKQPAPKAPALPKAPARVR